KQVIMSTIELKKDSTSNLMPQQQQSDAATDDEPRRKRHRPSTDIMASIGPDSSMANLDDDDNKASGPKDDTIGSLLSPNEAYSRKRRTPGASEKQQQLAPDNGAGVARRRQSRTPEGAGGASGGRDGRAERRFAKAQELAATEGNYVRILQVIVDIIRAEVAELLPPKAADLIFTGLAPIYDLHRDIESDLRAALANWDTGSTTIGSVFASRADKLSQLYPPFVNFFGQAKEELAKWEKKCSKFRAYLRQCRDRPECLRQSLSDLMIRPVQRLPSVTLILADLLKYTSEDSPDYVCLQTALASVRRVLEHINEEKRTTDLRVALFDVMNEVENFPPYLLSAHRTIVDRFDVVEVGSSGTGICRPGAGLTLFLLTDYLLVAKRRQSVASSASTASSAGGGGGGGGPGSSNRYRSPRPGPGSISTRTPSAAKPLRYLELLPLNSVRAVHDIRAPAVDPEDRRRLFAIECRLAACDDTDDETAPPCQFCFALAEPLVLSGSGGPNDEPFEVAANSSTVNEASTLASGGGRDKSSILRSVCEQIGRVTCCPNPLDLLLSHSDPAAFPLNLVGIFDRQNLLSAKARRFGRRVVTRVLSNRTPRRTISRALLAAATAAAPSASTQQQPDKPCPAMMADDGFEGNQPESPMMTVRSAAAFPDDEDAHMADAAGTPRVAANPLAENVDVLQNQQRKAPDGQQQVFKKPDKRPKSRPSSSLMSSVCRLNWGSLRHSIAGGKKASSSSADAPASAVSTSRLSRKKQLVSSGSLSMALRKGSDMDCSSSSLASLAVVGESNSTVRNPDDPYDMDDYEDGHKDCEQYDSVSISAVSAAGRGSRLGNMSVARASTATLANVEQLRCDSIAHLGSAAAVAVSSSSSGSVASVAAAAASASSRFSIGGSGHSSSGSTSSSAKRFRKHFSSWSLFK
ncbi:hypothetical protein BOX15_Mlig009094g1, partial [Macrostomum lignano]